MATRPPPAWYDANRPKRDADIAQGLILTPIEYSKLKLEIAVWWKNTIGTADTSYVGSLGKQTRGEHFNRLKAQFPEFTHPPEAWTLQAFQGLVTSLRSMVGVSKKKSSARSKRTRKEQLEEDKSSEDDEERPPKFVPNLKESKRTEAKTRTVKSASPLPPPQLPSLDSGLINDRRPGSSERALSIRGGATTSDAITRNPQLSGYSGGSEGPVPIERLQLHLYAGAPDKSPPDAFATFEASSIWDEKKGLHSMTSLREEIDSYREDEGVDPDYVVYIVPRSTASAARIKIKTDRTLTSALNDVASLTKDAKVHLTSKVQQPQQATASPTPQHIGFTKHPEKLEPASQPSLPKAKADVITAPTLRHSPDQLGSPMVPPLISKFNAINSGSSRTGTNGERPGVRRPEDVPEETLNNNDQLFETRAEGETNENQSPSQRTPLGAAATDHAQDIDPMQSEGRPHRRKRSASEKAPPAKKKRTKTVIDEDDDDDAFTPPPESREGKLPRQEGSGPQTRSAVHAAQPGTENESDLLGADALMVSTFCVSTQLLELILIGWRDHVGRPRQHEHDRRRTLTNCRERPRIGAP